MTAEKAPAALVAHRLPVRWIAVSLAALWWGMAFTAASGKSNVFDEPLHQTGGFTYWTLGDYRVQPENGVLPQRLFALPLLPDAQRWRFVPSDSPLWRSSEQWTLAHRFFFGLGNDFRSMLARGRAVAACVGAGVVLLVFFWSSRLFGRREALLSGLLAAFSPTLLAHGPLMTSDALMALLLPGFLGLAWRSCQRITTGGVLGSALVAGLLFTTKYSALLVLPMVVLLVALRLFDGRPLEVAIGRRQWTLASRSRQGLALLAVAVVHVAMIVLVIWALYGFRYDAMAHAGPGDRLFNTWDQLIARPGLLPAAVAFGREHRLLPEAYLYGLAFVDAHAGARFAFLAGSFGVQGWWWFFPYAFAVKTPLALFVLLALSGAAATRRSAPGRALYETAPLWVLLGVYGSAALTSSVNVGVRHVLPMLPALFILAGPAARWVSRARPVRAALTLAALAWFVAASLWIRPDYLAYFNETVGPRAGYRHLVDSSLDWGQELPALADWLDRNARPGEPVYLSYFGSSSPPAWGVEAARLPSYHDWPVPGAPVSPLFPGLYCISATMLQAVYLDPPGPWTREYEQAWQAASRRVAPLFDRDVPLARRNQLLADPELRQDWRSFERLRFGRLAAALRWREPDAQVGHSILVFRLADDELRAALYGPPPERARAVPGQGPIGGES